MNSLNMLVNKFKYIISTKLFIFLVKLFLTILLLYLSFANVDFYEIKKLIKTINLSNLQIYALLIFFIPLIVSFRMQLVSSLSGVKVPLKNIITYTYSCHFINQFIPFPSFGDIVKVFFLKKYTSLKKTTQIIISDRLIGMLGLSFLSLIFLLSILVLSFLQVDSKTNNNLILILIAFLFFILMFFKFLPNVFSKFDFTFLNFFLEIFSIVNNVFYRSNCFKILLLTSVLIFIDLSILILIMKLLDVAIIIFLLLYAPIVILFSLFPITFAGWGLREFLFLTFLSPYISDLSLVITISIIFGLFLSIGSLPGLVFIIRNLFKVKS